MILYEQKDSAKRANKKHITHYLKNLRRGDVVFYRWDIRAFLTFYIFSLPLVSAYHLCSFPVRDADSPGRPRVSVRIRYSLLQLHVN